MSRVGAGLLAIGVLALAATWALSSFAAIPALPSYLAAWLLCLGVPVGALTLVMAAEIVGLGAAREVASLRAILAPLPLLAVLAVPVLLDPGRLYRFTGVEAGTFVLRAVLILVVWSLLSLVFLRAPTRNAVPRRALAVIGLMLNLALVSIAGVLWVLALDPKFGSSSFGLLFLASQCAAAAALAALMPRRRGTERAAGIEATLLVLVGTWAFLQFTQFLIVWSANLPDEVVWYLRRDAGLGRFAEWEFAGACVLAVLLLLPRPKSEIGISVIAAAVFILIAHVLEAYWLVTPAFRDGLSVTLPDLLALLGLGGVLAGASVATTRWKNDHGAA